MMTESELAEWLLTQGYLKTRVLEDGTVIALLELATTRSVCLDCNEHSWERRFCFANRRLADEWFEEIKTSEDVPATGYVARRPQFEDHADPYLNDLHRRPWYRVHENPPRCYNSQ